MGLTRLLTLLAFAWIGWLLYRRWQRFQQQRRKMPVKRAETTSSGTMLRCAHCGVHVLAEEALMHQQQAYCCVAHQEAALRQQDSSQK